MNIRFFDKAIQKKFIEKTPLVPQGFKETRTNLISLSTLHNFAGRPPPIGSEYYLFGGGIGITATPPLITFLIPVEIHMTPLNIID